MSEHKKVLITFHRKKFCPVTCEYLCSKLDADNEEESNIMAQLRGLTDESITKLLAKDANELVKRLLQAIIIDDDLDTEYDTDYKSVPNESELDSEHETDGEDGNITIMELPNDESKQGSSKTNEILTFKTPQVKKITKQMPKITKNKTEVILCKFYKNGRCNKNKSECKFDHPKICHKFNQFGPKNGINKGCDENCGFFHPNACRNSVKDRTCRYSECRFYHLKDTILISKQTKQYSSNSQKQNTFKKHENYKPKFSKNQVCLKHNLKPKP